MLFPNGAIFRHVATCLSHEPDGRRVDWQTLAGAYKVRFGSGHE